MNHLPVRHLLLLSIAFILGSQLAAAQIQTPSPSPVQTPRSAPLSVPPGTFLGGVPSCEPTTGVEKLTVLSAISRALEHNLGVLSAEHAGAR